VYSAKIDGEPTTFGTSGLLYRSNKLMYDRKTNTLWSSLLGVPVIGELAQRDLKLDFFPVELTIWSEWLAEHPDTTVLSLSTGYYPQSFYTPEVDPDSAYFDYRTAADTMFPIWDRDDRLDAREEVLGLTDGVDFKAYPVSTLRAMRVVNDRVGDEEVVIVASAGSSNARVYQRQGQRFGLLPGEMAQGLPAAVIDGDGNRWTVTDDGLTDDSGVVLRRISANISFWFAWFAFHPETELFEGR
jgi:hypothetical protein